MLPNFFVRLSILLLAPFLVSCTQAWPYQSEAEDFFVERRADFEVIASRFDFDERLEQVDFYPIAESPIGICARRGSDKWCEEEEDAALKEALNRTAPIVFRIDNGLLFSMGSDSRGDIQFDIAIVRLDVASDNPCPARPPLTEFGNCDQNILDNWFIHYQWMDLEALMERSASTEPD